MQVLLTGHRATEPEQRNSTLVSHAPKVLNVQAQITIAFKPQF